MTRAKALISQMVLMLSSLLMASCGGGAPGQLPVVTDIQIDQVRYGQTSTIKLLGSNLTKDFQVSISNCQGLVVLVGGNDGEQNVSCKPNAVGLLEVSTKSMDGVLMTVKGFEIPNPQVKISSNFGDMVVELNAVAAPITVNNFLKYVNANFYNNTIFHRLIAQFVVQGGWLTTAMTEQGGAGAAIVLESNNGLKNKRGSIGMARATLPNSATTQFYFNFVDNAKLDYQNEQAPGYAVFGQIVEGLNVLDIFAQISTATLYGLDNFPTSNLVIKSMVQVK
jgi:cyclophilin family peptidyl-prolyl cis-trans isomerase